MIEVDPGSNWKNKYLDTLGQLEAATKRWAQMETLLKRSLSRAALLAQGWNPQLDQAVDRLRTSLRAEEDHDALLQYTDELVDSLTALEATPTGRWMAEPGQLLLPLIAQVVWPREQRREVKRIRRKLEDIRYLSELTEILPDLVGILVAALQVEPPSTPAAPSLWQRLFSWRGLREQDRGPSGVSHDVLPAEFGTLLVAVIDRLPLVTRPEVATLRQTLLDLPERASRQDWLELLRAELSEWLGAERYPEASRTGEEPTYELSHLLLELVDRLEMPNESDAKLQKLRAMLQDSSVRTVSPELLAGITDLVVVMRLRLESERRDLGLFLAAVSSQLRDFDAGLRGIVAVNDDAAVDGGRFHENIGDAVATMARTVSESQNLTELKEIVAAKLGQIRIHMGEFQDSYRRRQGEAEQQCRDLQQRIRQLETEATNLRDKLKDEHAQSLVDPLTGIANRLAYEERMQQEWSRWKRFGQPLAVILFDVDYFKKVNDRHGHSVGDRVLAGVAKLLASNVRATDFIARYGGEEFVLLTPGAGGEEAISLANKLRERVAACQFKYGDLVVPVTVSCGVAEFTEDCTPKSVFDVADKALYQAKRNGRNQVMSSLALTDGVAV